MAISPTQFAKKTAQCKSYARINHLTELIRQTATSWSDAKRRVLSSYREWIRGVRPPKSPLEAIYRLEFGVGNCAAGGVLL